MSISLNRFLMDFSSTPFFISLNSYNVMYSFLIKALLIRPFKIFILAKG